MPTSIEQRVVQMRFDNKQFEAGIAQSMSTLNKFDQRLKFKDASKGFDSISRAADKVSLSGLTKQADSVSMKFDAMAVVAVSALNRITNAAISAGTNLVKSLSIDQVSAGFSKYEARTAAVQTLVNATGRTVEDIERYMSKLMMYSDETSYGFSDMTTALGTMVSAGGDIEKLVPLLEGFGNAVSFVGKGAAEYSRAVVQLSQGYGRNALMLEDWKSIESTLGGAKQLKEVFIEVGEELGKIQKGTIDAGTFNETLKDKWLDQSVMEEALGRFGEMTERAFEMIEAGEVETVSQAYEVLSQTVDDYRIRAAKAAQEAKSFTEAIDATKDAVSTKWMESFQIIFGNYEEATQLWTELTNTLYDLFAAGGDVRNEMLSLWKSMGGRTKAIEAIKAAFEALSKPLDAIAEAFMRIFMPADTLIGGSWIYSATVAIYEFWKGLIMTDEAAQGLKIIVMSLLLPVQALVQAVRIGFAVFANLIKIIFALGEALLTLPTIIDQVKNPFEVLFGEERYARLVTAIITIIDNLGAAFTTIGNRIKEVSKSMGKFTSTKFQNAFEKLMDIIMPLGDWILDKIVEGFEALATIDYSKITEWAIFAIDSLAIGFTLISDACTTAIIAVLDFFASFKDMDAIEIIMEIVKGVMSLKTNMMDFIKSLGFNQIMSALQSEAAGVADVIGNLGDAVQSLLGRLTPAKILIFSFGTSLVWVFTNLATAIAAFKKVADGLVGMFGAITSIVKALQQKLAGSKILQLAVVIGVLAISLGALAQVPADRLAASTMSLGILMTVFGALMGAMAAINKFLVGSEEMAESLIKVATAMMMMSGSVAVLSGALLIMSKVDMEGMIGKLVMLAIIMGVLGVASVAIANAAPELSQGAVFLLFFALSIGVVVSSLEALGKADLSGVSEKIGILIAIMGMLAGLSAVSSKVSFGSSVGLTLLIGDILLFVGVLRMLGTANLTEVAMGIAMFTATLVAIVPMAIIAKVAGKEMSQAGTMLLSMAASVAVLAFAIKMIGELDLGTIAKGTISVGALLTLFSLLTGAARVTRKDSKIVTQSYMAMAGAILILGVAINYIGNLELATVVKGTIAVGALIGFLSLLSNSVAHTQKATGAVAAMAVCIGLVVASMALLTLIDPNELLASSASLALAFVGVGAMFKAIESVNMGSAIAATGLMIVALIGVWKLVEQLDGLKSESILENAKGVGLILAALGASIALIGHNKDLAFIDWAGVGQILVTMVGMLAMVTAIEAIINQIELREGLLEKVAALDLLMLGLAGSLALLKGIKGDVGDLGQVQALGVAAVALGGVASGMMVVLNLVKDTNGIMEKVAAVDALLLGLASSLSILKMIDGDIGDVKNLSIAAAALGGVVSVMMIALGVVEDPTGIIEKSAAMSLVLLALSGALGIVSMVSGQLSGLDASMGSIITIAGTLGVLVTVIIGILSMIPADSSLMTKALAMSGLIIVIAGVATTLALFGKVFQKSSAAIPDIIGWLALVDGVIVAIVAEIVAFGIIVDQFSIIEDGINKAGEIFVKLGSFIGDFIGNILGGIADKFVEGTIESFGLALSAFARNAKDFFDMRVDPELAVSVARLAGVAAVLTGTSMLNALSFFTGGGSMNFVRFGQQLAEFAPYFAQFGASVADIPTGALDSSTKCLEALGTVLASVPTEGGLMGAIFGNKDLESFGRGLSDIAQGIVDYANIVNGGEITPETIEATNAIAEVVTKLVEHIPVTSGWITNFAKQDLEEFGGQLIAFAWAMVHFFDITAPIDVDKEHLETIIDAGTALAEFAKIIPSTGVLVDFFGGQDLGKFGEQLEDFGSGMSKFFYKMSNAHLSKDSIEKAITAGKGFVEISNMLEPNTGIGTWWESTSLETFGDQIEKLGTSMANFYTNTSKVSWVSVSSAVNQLERIAALAPSLDAVDESMATGFSDFLKDLGSSGVRTFSDAFSNAESDIYNAIYNTINSAIRDVGSGFSQSKFDYSFVIDGLISSITSRYGELKNKGIDMVMMVKNGIESQSDKLSEVGTFMAKGIARAFSNSVDNIEKAVRKVMTRAIEVAKDVLDIRTTYSLEFYDIGTYTIDGYIKGLNENSGSLYNTLSKIGEKVVSTFEDSVGVNSPSVKFAEIGMYTILGLKKGIDENVDVATRSMFKMGERLLKTIRDFFGINSPSTVTRDEVGRYIVDGIAVGITTTTSAEDAASQKAQNIINAFKEEFDKWDLDTETADLEFQLWEALNQNATEEEYSAKQAELLDKKLSHQAEKVNAANAQYQVTLEQLGESAKQTQEAYNTYLKEQITLAELAAELIDLQRGEVSEVNGDGEQKYVGMLLSTFDSDVVATRKAIDLYGDIMMNIRDTLLGQGFTLEEIEEVARRESGFVPLKKVVSETEDEAEEISDIMDRYLSKATGTIDGIAGHIEYVIPDTIGNTIQEAEEEVTVAGYSLGVKAASSIGGGITANSPAISSSITKAMNDAMLDFDPTALFSPSGEGGVLDMLSGINETLRKGGGDVVDWIGEKTQPFVDGVKNFFSPFSNSIPKAIPVAEDGGSQVAEAAIKGLSSAHNEAISVGEQMSLGFANGITSNSAVVYDAVTSMLAKVIDVTNTILDINSPSREYYDIGMMMDQGLANGIIDGTSVVTSSIMQVLAAAQNTIDSNPLYISPVIVDGQAMERSLEDIWMGGYANPNDLSSYVEFLQWDANGNLVPTGVSNTGKADGSRWIIVDSELANAIRYLGDAEAERLAYEKANSGKFEGTPEELRELIKEANESPGSVNLIQNNYSPESLTASETVRRMGTIVSKISSTLFPSGTSLNTIGTGISNAAGQYFNYFKNNSDKLSK